MRPPPDPGNRAPPGPPLAPDAPHLLPTWRSSSPAFHPRRTSSGDGQLHAPPPLNLTRLGSGSSLGAAGPPPPSSPPAFDPTTEANVWAALACTATAGCADPALAALADAADGAAGLRVAPALPFTSEATTSATPALPHLAHPSSVEAPAWLERLAVVGGEKEGGGEASTSTSTTSLATPPVVVGCRGAWLALPPAALAHWDRGGPFTPAGGPKAVSYVALVPRGAEGAVDGLLASISRAWLGFGLGTHAPAGAAPGAGARGIIAYDGAGGLPALARAYAALQLALARARPPVRWPGVEDGRDDARLLGTASPDGSLAVYVLPPPTPGRDACGDEAAVTALHALIACARAPTAPPPPAATTLSRLHRSSDGVGSTAALPRPSSDAGTATTTTTTTSLSRGSTPDWYRTAARDTYRRESGGGGSRPGSPALGHQHSASCGDDPDGRPVAVPCTIQVLPGRTEDLTDRKARTLAFCVFNKVVVGGPPAKAAGSRPPLHHQPLVALQHPAGPAAAVHCAFAVVPPGRAVASPDDSTLIALAFTDGTGELAPGARVVRVGGQQQASLPSAVLAVCDEVFTRAVACASRDGTRPVRQVITRLGAPPPAEAAAWEAALGEGNGRHPPACVVALSADPPVRLACLGGRRAAPFVSVVKPDRACIVWADEDETVRAGVVARVAGEVDLAAAAAELHALGALAGAAEAAVVGDGEWGSVSAHLPGHCATVLRLARLAAAGAAL